MESIDQSLQQRVWQRVQRSGPEPPGPEGLLLEERTDEATARKLGLGTLADQAAERAAVLQGICRLSGLSDPVLRPSAQQSNDPLRHLMGRLLRRHREYTRLTAHEEFGILYGSLAQKCADSCLLLAARIGSSNSTNSLQNRRR